MDDQIFTPQMGMDVIGSDGEKVGEIDAVEQDYFVVRKGFFFPSDHYIPFSAVDSYDDNALYLNVTKDGALDQQWGDAPVSSTTSTNVGVDERMGVDGTTAAGTWGQADVENDSYSGVSDVSANNDVLSADVTDRDLGGYDAGYSDRNVGTYEGGDDTIEVREENLAARTREVERGAVHVDKHVIEEQQTLEVPVTEEEVHIERRAVDRPAGSIDLDEASYEIPLRGEEVELTREARVVEEIDIDKTARERTETVSGTVRREEVEIDTDVDVDGTHLHRDGGSTQGDDRGLLDKAKDALDPNNDGRNR
jgi:uncharacterized protein (TIGR02271 family)